MIKEAHDKLHEILTALSDGKITTRKAFHRIEKIMEFKVVINKYLRDLNLTNPFIFSSNLCKSCVTENCPSRDIQNITTCSQCIKKNERKELSQNRKNGRGLEE